MNPEQAEIMLGLMIQHHYPFSSAKETGLLGNEMELLAKAFGYNLLSF